MCKIKIFGLGGLDENGKNAYVVEIDDDIFVFDCGLKYATGNLLGIDYIIPDFSYLIKNQDITPAKITADAIQIPYIGN